MSTKQQAMQPIVRGVSIVSKVEERASPHAVVSEGELPEVGVDYAYLGAGRIPSDNFGVQVQMHRVPGCDTGAGEGH